MEDQEQDKKLLVERRARRDQLWADLITEERALMEAEGRPGYPSGFTGLPSIAFADPALGSAAFVTQPTSVLNALASEAHAEARAKGFWGPPDAPREERDFGHLLMLVVSEAVEALEAWRDGMPVGKMLYEHGRYSKYLDESKEDDERNPGKPVGIPSELADVIIRVFDICGAYGIDIGTAVAIKMAYNSTRPPKHGRKR